MAAHFIVRAALDEQVLAVSESAILEIVLVGERDGVEHGDSPGGQGNEHGFPERMAFELGQE